MSKNYAIIIQFVLPLTKFYRSGAQRNNVYKRDAWRSHNRAWQPRRHDRLSETSGTLWIHRGALTNQRCSLATGCGIKVRIQKKSKLRVTGLCEGNSPVTGEFPAQRTSNAEIFPFDDVIMDWVVARSQVQKFYLHRKCANSKKFLACLGIVHSCHKYHSHFIFLENVCCWIVTSFNGCHFEMQLLLHFNKNYFLRIDMNYIPYVLLSMNFLKQCNII